MSRICTSKPAQTSLCTPETGTKAGIVLRNRSTSLFQHRSEHPGPTPRPDPPSPVQQTHNKAQQTPRSNTDATLKTHKQSPGLGRLSRAKQAVQALEDIRVADVSTCASIRVRFSPCASPGWMQEAECCKQGRG